ncbi:MAG TPA: hypothetical protein DHN29_22690 [Cytophagales bacterium]|nr:hypothetical protein [Cytophagales bacterium]
MNNQRPPGFFIWFFQWYCRQNLQEFILGDLEEQFEQDIEDFGSTRARRRFAWNVLRFFRPGIVRPIFGSIKLNNTGMFKNMMTLAWRNALRQKQFTLINLFGLTLGIAACLMISLYVYDELNYDKFHTKADRIYRVNQPSIWGDWDEMIASTGPNVATALREEVPEFEEVTRVMQVGSLVVTPNQKQTIFKEDRIFGAEENFFKLFDFTLLHGSAETAFSQPNSIVLTEETAKRYFGDEVDFTGLMDQSIEVKEWDGNWKPFKIVGILKDISEQSHLQFDMLASMSSYQGQMDNHGWKWIWNIFGTYVLVKPNVDVAQLEERIQDLPAKWAAPTTERIFNQTVEEFTKGHPWTLELQSLGTVYSDGSPVDHGLGPTGNPLFIKIFTAIGVLVLLLSAINFMNLSTARSTGRAKEVGVRKVLGSARSILVNQFILESIMYVALATLLGIGLVFLSVDWFNSLTFKEMDLVGLLSQPTVITALAAFILIVGGLAGFYPAMVISAFKPVQALKGHSGHAIGGKWVRNGLVVFQFTVSIALIICAAFVQKQLTYVSNLDLGMDKENVLQIHNIEQFGFETGQLKSKLESLPAFTKVGKSFGLPPNILSGDRYMADEVQSEVVQMRNVRLEGDYLNLLDVEFVEGRNYDSSRPADKDKVIINESAVKVLGWSGEDEILGKKIALASGDEDKFEVIGVVKDFNINSAKSVINPLVIIHQDNDQVWDYGLGLSYFSLKLDETKVKSSGELMAAIQQVEKILAETDATVPFEYSFMDQEFDKTFLFEQRMGVVLSVFTALALVIGCLGLFGLAAFAADRRVKELGIRKVLGASIAELWVSFSSEFSMLLIIAVLIAIPFSWYCVDQWLTNFAFRTPIDWWVFGIAIIGAFLLAIATITYQSLKVAYKNPVESLRDE